MTAVFSGITDQKNFEVYRGDAVYIFQTISYDTLTYWLINIVIKVCNVQTIMPLLNMVEMVPP